jgi:hypothetical protein
MFNLANETPYAAERTLICDKDGRDVWVVAVKGTFEIKPDGTTVAADEQEPVKQSPIHFGDPLTSSLKYECDLDYTKPTTDVLLHGHAYAPKGKPTIGVEVSMKVASINKSLRVTGDRSWQEGVLGLRLSEPEPFLKIPLVYERSYGGADLTSENPKKRGWEPRNPVGRGYSAGSSPSQGQMAPNIEAKSSSFIRAPRPAGFGPIARHWAPRAQFAGTYDAAWEQRRYPLLPKDFDERFFQCAPEDQQTPQYLRGNEEVELKNLNPEGELKFRLPKVALSLVTKLAGEEIRHRPKLYTVIIKPDVPRVILVWHDSVQCAGRKMKLVGTSVVEKPYIK